MTTLNLNARQTALNADRVLDIVDALAKLGTTTPSALAQWLGRPMCFAANVAALIADERVIETQRHGRTGIIIEITIAELS